MFTHGLDVFDVFDLGAAEVDADVALALDDMMFEVVDDNR